MAIATHNLERAAELSRKADEIQAEIAQLLAGGDSAPVQATPRNATSQKAAPKRRVSAKRSGLSATGRKIAKHLNGKQAQGENQGLAPAVVSILKKNKDPMRVGEIFDALVASKYRFAGKSKTPKRVLAARIYSLRGVKKVGDGLFAAE